MGLWIACPHCDWGMDTDQFPRTDPQWIRDHIQTKHPEWIALGAPVGAEQPAMPLGEGDTP